MRGARAGRAGERGRVAATTARCSRAGQGTTAARFAQMGGLDNAQLPDWLAHCASAVPAWRDTDVALAASSSSRRSRNGCWRPSRTQECELRGCRHCPTPGAMRSREPRAIRARRPMTSSPKRWSGLATGPWPIPARPSRSRSRISNRDARKFARWPTRYFAHRCSGRSTKRTRARTNVSLGTRLSEVPLAAVRARRHRACACAVTNGPRRGAASLALRRRRTGRLARSGAARGEVAVRRPKRDVPHCDCRGGGTARSHVRAAPASRRRCAAPAGECATAGVGGSLAGLARRRGLAR